MFTHEIRIAAAWDKRDPNPSKNYGIHGVHITFTIKKDGEGLTFSVSTDWQLPHVAAEFEARNYPLRGPTAFGVDIHRKTKPNDYAGFRSQCEVTGGECWCDGSGILGDSFLQTLIEGGDEALFSRMEQQFEDWIK